MKSIKPGRGPSMMGGIMGIVVAIFGVFWTAFAINIGGGFIAIFGVIFVIIAIGQAIYNFKNATSNNRYSTFDIVDGEEEPDPFNERYGINNNNLKNKDSNYCPYCGNPVSLNFKFCNKCGKELP